MKLPGWRESSSGIPRLWLGRWRVRDKPMSRDLRRVLRAFPPKSGTSATAFSFLINSITRPPASGIPQKGISVATDKQRLSGLSLDDSEIKANPHADCRSEEHTSELQSRLHLVCRLLLEKKKNITITHNLNNNSH